nr:uncharacterized protein C16orf95 homolog isoform X2 [Ictidomys tridecemlineatus]
MEAHGADGSGDAILSPSPGLPSRPERKSTFQTLRREVHSPGGSMCLGHCSLPQEPVCCECQVKFQGHWPVPRAEAALPYWVPLSLRPQKQIPRMVQFCIPKATKTCACPCHHFGGRLPLPRTKAVMPYWVPRGLRSQRKVVRKQRNLKALQGDWASGWLTSPPWEGGPRSLLVGGEGSLPQTSAEQGTLLCLPAHQRSAPPAALSQCPRGLQLPVSQPCWAGQGLQCFSCRLLSSRCGVRACV